MENLDSLNAQLRDAKDELEKITMEERESVPLAPGAMSEHKSEAYSYGKYTDANKAYRLKDRIADLENKIKIYAQSGQVEGEKSISDSQIPKRDYTPVEKIQTTTNPTVGAEYNSQHRFFGISKLKRTIMVTSSQKRKFKILWIKANTTNKKTQEQVAFELNKVFR